MYRFSAILLLLYLFSNSFSSSLPKHWHESKGYGTGTSAGLGGKVYKVTSLNNSGPGSLREAVEASGQRLIVFEVGGVIDLQGNRLVLKNGQATIAGQTAPSPGITLVRGNFTVYANDVVVSHMTVQLGDKVSGFPDCVNISDKGNQNIVFDHVSVYWSKDENLSMNGPKDVTLYKCLIAEGLQYCGHEDGEHSKGSLINKAENLALIGTLYAHNAMRNPRSEDGKLLIVNGAAYNWAPGWDHEPTFFNHVAHFTRDVISFVGNVAIQGPESKGEIYVDGHHSELRASAYMKDNLIVDKSGKELAVYNKKVITALEKPPLWPDGFEAVPAHESIYEILRTAGSRPGDRDRHNSRVFKTVADGKGEVIDSQDEVGGYANYAPSSRVVNVPDGTNARQSWLDSLEDQIAVDRVIDLSRLYTMIGSEKSDRYASQTSSKLQPCGGGTRMTALQQQSSTSHLKLHLELPVAGMVRMTLFDMTGSVAVQEPEKYFRSGSHEVMIPVHQVPAGLYLCRIQMDGTILNYRFYHY